MQPDWLWITMFALGGIAMGLITSLIGLRKGREVYGWLLLYAFMVTAVVMLDVPQPFWTILIGSVIAGLCTGLVQGALMRWYRKNNPWYAQEMQKPPARVAGSFIAFALIMGGLFGLMAGGIAWGLSLI